MDAARSGRVHLHSLTTNHRAAFIAHLPAAYLRRRSVFKPFLATEKSDCFLFFNPLKRTFFSLLCARERETLMPERSITRLPPPHT